MNIERIGTLPQRIAAAFLLLACSANATLLNIDGLIFQNAGGVNPALMSGTLDYTPAGNTAIFVMTNTSPDGAFTDSSAVASMLLTGFGVQLGRNILGGSATVTGGGTAINFTSGQSLSDISNRYGYANQAIAFYLDPSVIAVSNVVTSVNNGQLAAHFAGNDALGGPDFGAVSANETQFASGGQAGVRNSVTFILNLDGAAPSFATVNAGNVVLAFGSPTDSPPQVPDQGYTLALLGLGLAPLALFRRKSR